MSRTVAAGSMPADIQAQVEAKLAGDASIRPAAVKPGIVPGTEPKKSKPSSVRSESTMPAPVEKPGAPGSTMASAQAQDDAFLMVARDKIAAADKQADEFSADLTVKKQPRRGLLLDQPEETDEERLERDEKGRFKPAAPATQAEAEDEDDDEAAVQAPVADDDDDDEVVEQPIVAAKPEKLTHEKALALLRLDGFKSKALEKLSPEEVMELASHRAKVRSGVEQMASELAAVKKGGNAATKTSPATESGTASPATTASSFDVKKVTTRFRETYGDEEALSVEEPLAALAGHFDETLKREKQSLQPLFNMIGEMRVELVRNKLERVSPELADDAVWGPVMRKAQKLNPEAYGGDVSAVLQDASQLVLTKIRNGVSSDANRSARMRGQPATGSRREAPVPMSKHDAFGALAVAIENGDTEEVDRIRRSM